MINKMEYDGRIGTFGQEDIDVLVTFAQLVGRRLRHSPLVVNNQISPSRSTPKWTAGIEGRRGSSGRRRSAGEWRNSQSLNQRSSSIAECQEEEDDFVPRHSAPPGLI